MDFHRRAAGWKAGDNGLEHARVCERALASQGKTGLRGVTKPGNYVGFITFSIKLFDALESRGCRVYSHQLCRQSDVDARLLPHLRVANSGVAALAG